MSFDAIFRNRIKQPLARPMLAQGGEQTIVWSADASGVLKRLEALEAEVARLRSQVEATRRPPAPDLDPDPNVEVTTGYEYASDGTLRAYADVAVSGQGIYEVALLGEPTVVEATKDATVRQDFPNNNYSTINISGLPTANAEHRAWLQFPWGTWPSGLWAVEPVLALLRLTKTGTYNDDGATVALRLEDMDGADWGETAITWNTQPAVEEITLDSVINQTADTVHFYDLTPLFARLREARSGPWSGTPYGLVLCAGDTTPTGRVGYYTRHESLADRRPQIWYWERAEKTQLLGGAVRTARIYGTPGATYYLVHRLLDENNRPGRWSAPVEVEMPSQGDTPSKPAAPTKTDTDISNQKILQLDTSVPSDFAHYYIRIYDASTSTTTYLRTRADRFAHWFSGPVAMTPSAYEVSYKVVTRSGAESPYSDALSFSVDPTLELTSPDGGSSLCLYNELSDATITVDGSLGDLMAAGSEGTYTILTDRDKSVGHNVLLHSSGQASYDTEQSTTSTSWVDRTSGSITLTPPGTGNAYYLLVGKVTLFKDGANEMKVTFKVDGTTTNDEEGYSASSTAETVTIARRVAVTAGRSHTFKLCFKSVDGGSCTVYRSVIVALHLGNY